MPSLRQSYFISSSSVLWLQVARVAALSALALLPLHLLAAQLLLLPTPASTPSLLSLGRWLSARSLAVLAASLAWQLATLALRAASISGAASAPPPGLRVFAALSSRRAWRHALWHVALLVLALGLARTLLAAAGALSRGADSGPAALSLSIACGEGAVSMLDALPGSELFLSEHELRLALGSDAAAPPAASDTLTRARLSVAPRCVHGEGALLFLCALVAAAVSAFRWRISGLARVLVGAPELWNDDEVLSGPFFRSSETKRALPRDSVSWRASSSLWTALAEASTVICTTLLVLTVLGASVMAAPSTAVGALLSFDASLSFFLARDRALSVVFSAAADTIASMHSGAGLWAVRAAFPALVRLFAATVCIAATHGLHSALLGVFLVDRVDLGELVRGVLRAPLQPSGDVRGSLDCLVATVPGAALGGAALGGAAPSAEVAKMDLVLIALRTVRPRSLAHYMASFPAEAFSFASSGAGSLPGDGIGDGSRVGQGSLYSSAQRSSVLTFVPPSWHAPLAPRVVSLRVWACTACTLENDIAAERCAACEGGRPEVARPPPGPLAPQRPGLLTLPNLPASLQRFQQTGEASLVRAWQIRLALGNWALFAGEVRVFGAAGANRELFRRDPTLAGDEVELDPSASAFAPLLQLAAMIGIGVAPASALAQERWESPSALPLAARVREQAKALSSARLYEPVLATNSPWLLLLRDVVLCAESPPTAASLAMLALRDVEPAAASDCMPDFLFASVDSPHAAPTGSEALASPRAAAAATPSAGAMSLRDLGSPFTAPQPRSSPAVARAFVRSAGVGDGPDRAAPTSAECKRLFATPSPVSPVAAAGGWRELAWAATALIDTTTVALLAAAATDVWPAAGGPARPPAWQPAAPLAPGADIEGPGPAAVASAGLAALPAAFRGSGVARAGGVTRDGAMPLRHELRAVQRLEARPPAAVGRALSLSFGVLQWAAQPVAALSWPATWVFASARTAASRLLSAERARDRVGLFALWRHASSLVSGLDSQARPAEPAGEDAAAFWGGLRRSLPTLQAQRLRLSLDEVMGGAAVPAEGAASVSELLLEALAPELADKQQSLLRGVESPALGSSTISRRSAAPAPGAAFSAGAAEEDVVDSVRTLRERSQRRGSRGPKLAAATPAAGGRSAVAGEASSRGAARGVGDSVGALRPAPSAAPVSFAARALAVVRAGAAAALCPCRSRPPSGRGVAGAASAGRGAAQPAPGAAPWRAAFLRSPEEDTAALLHDVRAVCAAAELLTQAALQGLKDPASDAARQTRPTVAVVAYSLAACAAACAVYGASPRTRLSRDGDVAVEWLHPGERGGGGAGTGEGHLAAELRPGGKAASCAVPVRSRPALAVLQSTVMRCLLRLHLSRVPALPEQLVQLGERAPSLPVRVVLRLAALRAVRAGAKIAVPEGALGSGVSGVTLSLLEKSGVDVAGFIDRR